MQKTVHIDYTNAALITCTAKQDMPEAHIKAGEMFYLARSSQGDGTYYIIAWNGIDWLCRCPATKPCKHMKRLAAARVAAYLKQKEAAKVASPVWVTMPDGHQRLASQVNDTCLNTLAQMSKLYKDGVSIACKGSLAGAKQGFNLMR